MGNPVCPDCGESLDRVYVARSVELQWDHLENWIEKNVFSESIGCPKCHTELDRSMFGVAGMPLPTAI